MRAIRRHAIWMGAVSALALLAYAPGAAAPSKAPKRRAGVSFGLGGGLGSFTPAAADPRLAAAFARSGGASSSFQFTPSAVPGGRRAVTVAVRARTTQTPADRTAALAPATITPSAYNLGVSVGWKRFALSGAVAKIDSGAALGGREAVDLGVSYTADPKWTTRLQLGADRATERSRLVTDSGGYSVDVGSSYELTRNLAVTGGVRYRLQRDRIAPIADERRDSQAVYIGTAFRF